MPKRKKVRERDLDADKAARGQRFSEARQAVGLTLEDVSAAVGVAVTSAHRWERTGQIPAGDVLIRVAKLYRRAPEWLVFGTGAPELVDGSEEPPYRAYAEFLAGTWPETPLIRDWMFPRLRALRFPGEPDVETYRRAVLAYATVKMPPDKPASG